MNRFKNSQQLGSFGEFCYQKFAIQNGFSIEKIGILEYDFVVFASHKVDVKTTQTKKVKFTGKRVRSDISYDIVSVVDNKVTLYPDLTSPIIRFSGHVIGDIDVLYSEWMLNKSSKNKIVKKTNIHKFRRNLIEKNLQIIFPNKRLRVIFRGSVSKTRWSSSPDNIPGSFSKINNHDLTVFVQMLTLEESEEINKIYLFNHDRFNLIKMKTPDKRQIKKGIKNVIDFDWYEKNQPSLIFNSIEELKKYASCN